MEYKCRFFFEQRFTLKMSWKLEAGSGELEVLCMYIIYLYLDNRKQTTHNRQQKNEILQPPHP